jgi:nucleotide-binding universal stress UspA family protein
MLGPHEYVGRRAEMSIFPTKILLATDGSEEAQLALSTAVDQANSTNSELHLVTVGPWNPDPAYATHEANFRWQTYEEVIEAIGKEAQQILDEQVKKIEEAGGTVQEAHLRRGREDQEIVRLAEEIGAGLIVTGSRGRAGVRRALMGSVSDSVVRHAHCPVLVVRWKPVSFPAKILLATDGSEEAALAAQSAADLAARTASELHVTHVGKALSQGGFVAGVDVGPLPAGSQELLDKESKEVLEAQLARMGEAGGSVTEAHLMSGRADEEIILLAEQVGADLVVVGSQGLGGVRRTLVGSVADSVVRHAHCPVLMVRREDHQEPV